LPDTGIGDYRWVPGLGLGAITLDALAGAVRSTTEESISILPGTEFLTQTTANIECAVLSTGYIGADPFGDYRNASQTYPGFRYKGNPNALYSGGVIVGQSGGQMSGMIASFHRSTFEPLAPFSELTTDSLFDQRTTCTIREELPYHPVDIKQSTASRSGDNFIAFTYDVTNRSSETLSDFYIGVFADWDIGDLQANLGGIDTVRGLAYEHSNGGPDVNYYGIVALNGMSGAAVTTDSPDISFLQSAHMSGGAGDLRTFIGSGPSSIPPGETRSASFALLAAPSLAELQSTADSARRLWKQTAVSVGPVADEHLPLRHALAQNYPNPFNPSTMIKFDVAENVWVNLVVYDVLGREMKTLVNEMMKPGRYETTFEAAGLASGPYFYRLTAGSYIQTRRMLLVR